MEISKVICALAIGLILLVAFYKCPKKSEFKISNSNSLLPRNESDQPLGDLSGSLSALSGYQFRGGNEGFANMISSGLTNPVQKDIQIPELPTVQDILPDGMTVGTRQTEPFEMRDATVQLRDKARSSDLATLLAMIGQEPIHPVNSIHQIHDRSYHRATGIKFQLPGQEAFDPDLALMDLERV
mgnify:CR=1 FL=1